MFPLTRREAPRATWRLPATSQLIAPPCELVLPSLEKVSTEQRFAADAREVIALAEALATLDIAAVEDWKKSERDAAKYLLLTLQRWVRDHGGASIQRRFDLDLTLSDRLVDYSDERGPEGTLYLILDPDSAAFVLLNPTIELLGSVHPRLAATFFRHFAGSLNRGYACTTTTTQKSAWTCCASGTRAKRIPSSTKCLTLEDVRQSV